MLCFAIGIRNSGEATCRGANLIISDCLNAVSVLPPRAAALLTLCTDGFRMVAITSRPLIWSIGMMLAAVNEASGDLVWNKYLRSAGSSKTIATLAYVCCYEAWRVGLFPRAVDWRGLSSRLRLVRHIAPLRRGADRSLRRREGAKTLLRVTGPV